MSFKTYYGMRLSMHLIGMKPPNTFVDDNVHHAGIRNSFIMPNLIPVTNVMGEFHTY